MIRCLLSVFFFLVAKVAISQKLISLQVLNELHQPVVHALVQTPDGRFSSLSDDQGRVWLSSLTDEDSLVISGIAVERTVVKLGSMPINKGDRLVRLKIKDASPLGEVTVVTSSRNAINTISDLRLQLRSIRGSQDLLRQVPGLFIAQHAGGGKAEQMFLRGFDIDHGTDVLLEVDGIPVNKVSHAHGQGYADLHFLIPELVERISYGKGSYEAEKGNFATAGHVSFKSKSSIPRNFMKVELGQFGYKRALTGIRILNPKAPNGGNLYAAASLQGYDGYFEASQNFHRFNGQLTYHQSINDRNTLTATILSFKSQWMASGQIPERAVDDGTIGYFGAIDPTEGGRTSRHHVNLEWLRYLPGRWQLKQQLYAVDYRFKLFSNFTFFKVDSVNGDQIRQGEHRFLSGYHSTLKKESKIGSVYSSSLVGIQFRADNIGDLDLSRTRSRSQVVKALARGSVRERNLSAFAKQRFSPEGPWSFSASLRYDQFFNQYRDDISKENFSLKAGILSPKLSIDYQLHPGVKLYAMAGRGFHSNDTRVTVNETRNLVPTSFAADIGTSVQFSPRISLQSALWYIWLDQEFVYVGDEAIVEAGGSTRRYGADISAQAHFLKNLFLVLDVNVSDAQALHVPRSQSFIPLAPVFTSSGSLTYQQEKGFGASLSYQWMGNRPAVDDNSVMARGYFISDAAISYTSKKLQTSITTQNLFNVRWKETQFFTESRLRSEPEPVAEMHFTPGTPFFVRLSLAYWL